MPTYQELLERKRASVREVDAREAARLREQGSILIDVREQDEVDQGAVPGAVFIPRGFLEMRIEEAVRDRDTPVVLYCAGGVRSLFAAESLQQLGYSDVASMSGGFSGWKAAGLPWQVPQSLSPDQRRRSAEKGRRRRSMVRNSPAASWPIPSMRVSVVWSRRPVARKSSTRWRLARRDTPGRS